MPPSHACRTLDGMTGLELSRRYFLTHRAALADAFPGLFDRMAVGLIGHGSQCLGFDDEVSRDHDWGPQFCVFLERADAAASGGAVQAFLEGLPGEFQGHRVLWDAREPRERSGALCTDDWFAEQLGGRVPFEGPGDWLRTSDPRLLWATNGEIWHDPLGRVTGLRAELAYYPREVWLARVASKCLLVQILGPYQIGRALERGEALLPFLTRSYFVREALHLVFLLNGRYAPFFKWLLRSFERLPDRHGLGLDQVEAVLREPDPDALLARVRELADTLHAAVGGAFGDLPPSENLLERGFHLYERVEPDIRRLPFWDQEAVI